MTATSAELLRLIDAELGEGPAWDSQSQTLFWVDILAGDVHCERQDGTSVRRHLDTHVGAAMPSTQDSELLVLTRDGFHVLAADGALTPLARPLLHRPGMRFNDGKVDPGGRAFGGTMPYVRAAEPGALYRLDPGGVTTTCVKPVGLANGLGWTPDARTMYLVDSESNQVLRFDYEPDTAELANPSVLLDVPTRLGMPDGLCVDDDGGVWVAIWDGGACHRYTPEGRLDRVVDLPVTRPTSMCFAGPDLSTLVITSARYDLDDGQLAAQPLAGSLFAVDAGCTGPAATPWRPITPEEHGCT